MPNIVVMGVAGCGKSTLAAAVARRMGLRMVEGDDYHPEANRVKMRAGIPLDDHDRAGWLEALGRELGGSDGEVVLSCSALKADYRKRLRSFDPALQLVYLEIAEEEARRRIESRACHLFPASLLGSQFAALEPPFGEQGVLTLPATEPIDKLVAQVVGFAAREQR